MDSQTYVSGNFVVVRPDGGSVRDRTAWCYRFAAELIDAGVEGVRGSLAVHVVCAAPYRSDKRTQMLKSEIADIAARFGGG